MASRENFYNQVKRFPSHFNSMLAPQPDHMYFKGRRNEGPWITMRPYTTPKY
eukprot:CAMPEP_0168622602 /NCGR_PEP_ID=MMETSP0449_2-20121227/8360_1 /TAXON_ID=1082188 /ORGANISM="Strombidium rassoulzadegani, Strain ras09" /LENGTH=51 /DNA_ID=CAMNT_0008663889 /DNA_START=162 /DNA_END=317 /DNA_ORIENTATION=-